MLIILNPLIPLRGQLKQVKFVNVDPDIFRLKVANTDVNAEVTMIALKRTNLKHMTAKGLTLISALHVKKVFFTFLLSGAFRIKNVRLNKQPSVVFFCILR